MITLPEYPVTSEESFLEAICKGNASGLNAETHLESYLKAVADSVSTPEWPWDRVEEYLEAIKNGSTDVPLPETRVEDYLWCIATGDNSYLPETPETRFETYLAYWFENGAPSPETYEYITPIDEEEFPIRNGLNLLMLDGSEAWDGDDSGAVYTSSYVDAILQSRDYAVGYCEDYTFEPSVSTIESMSNDSFAFPGSAEMANGLLAFKNEHTSSADAWETYLEDHPVTILISTNSPDSSVWKPAKDSNGVTGYWNGDDGFVAVKGGIPYYGNNLITDEVIESAYNNAWISSQYVWTTASGSTSFAIPVDVGSYYKAEWDSTDSDIVGAVFRYGFTNNNVPGGSNTLSEPRTRSTPQDVSSVELLASGDYMVVQVASGTFPSNVGHLSIREMIGYTPSNDMLVGMNPPEGDET